MNRTEKGNQIFLSYVTQPYPGVKDLSTIDGNKW